MNLEELFNEYMGLSDSDKQSFIKLVGVDRAKEKASPGVLPEEAAMLYSVVQKQIKKDLGFQLPMISRHLVKSIAIEPALLETLDYLQIHKLPKSSDKLALYQLVAECSVAWARKQGLNFDNKFQLMRFLNNLSAATEQQYPGYMRSGILHTLASAVAKGMLKKVEEIDQADRLPD